MDDLLLRTECTIFFEANPYAMETAQSLAVRIGRSDLHLEPVLQHLVSLSIVSSTGTGANAVYRYNKPDKTVIT